MGPQSMRHLLFQIVVVVVEIILVSWVGSRVGILPESGGTLNVVSKMRQRIFRELCHHLQPAGRGPISAPQ